MGVVVVTTYLYRQEQDDLRVRMEVRQVEYVRQEIPARDGDLVIIM